MKNQLNARRLQTIRQIASELRNDRNRSATYAMKIARRYADWYCH